MKRTATIARYHCFGTDNHHLSVEYRGAVLQWTGGPLHHRMFADCVHWGPEAIEQCKAWARAHGFTHVRYVGEWAQGAKPAGGALC